MRCSTACGISTALLFFLEAACAALCAFCLGGMAAGASARVEHECTMGRRASAGGGGGSGGRVCTAAAWNVACRLALSAHCAAFQFSRSLLQAVRTPDTAPCPSSRLLGPCWLIFMSDRSG